VPRLDTPTSLEYHPLLDVTVSPSSGDSDNLMSEKEDVLSDREDILSRLYQNYLEELSTERKRNFHSRTGKDAHNLVCSTTFLAIPLLLLYNLSR